ncbi:hypothetical protein POM88_043501 [Heracleum sosnowskyi]|uniref:WAT1-related protein n=1 Tax=Heracleum sosnowskyi TaxID=360622 RepID=A0AAD8M4C5_9APIA|nr:hypothetical protein POM88_043501 [Heracleum sosnowskyi]
MTRVLSLQSFTTNVLPFAVMIMAECMEVTFLSLGKAAMNNGISSFVFVAYYNSLATLIFFSFFVLHVCRGNQLPLTFSLLCRFFVLGLVGICLLQIFGYVGMDYASATLGVAMGNLIPAFTFLLAVILSMEKVDLRTLSSASKVQLNRSYSQSIQIGYLVVVFLPSRAFLQPSGTFYRRQPLRGSWVLNPGIEMIAMVFAAVNCVTRASILTWCLHRKGPVYVSMFKPVSTAIAMITGIIFLGDTLYIGSVIGAATIFMGFYALVWGQNQEKQMVAVDFACEPESSNQTSLLLE